MKLQIIFRDKFTTTIIRGQMIFFFLDRSNRAAALDPRTIGRERENKNIEKFRASWFLREYVFY